MVYVNIVYTADSGVQYQVGVPSDFATALGQTLATTQPVLPPEIAPRYANFKTAAGTYRQAVIDTLANFATVIGLSVVVGGITYTGVSAVGQKIPAIQSVQANGAYFLQGPPGPPGPPFATTLSHAFLGSDTPLGGATDLCSLTPPAGTYIVGAFLTGFNPAGSNDVIEWYLRSISLSQVLAVSSFDVVSGGGFNAGALSGYVTLGGSDDITLTATSNLGTTEARRLAFDGGTAPSTGLWIAKVA